MMFVASDIPAHEWIDDEAGAQELLEQCLDAPVVAFDTETTGLDIMRDKAVMFSIAVPGRRAALPANKLKVFSPLLEFGVLAMHNSKYDMHIVENTCGIRTRATVYDTLPMAVMENTERSSYDLKTLASDGLFTPEDPRYIKYESIFGGRIKTAPDAIRILGLEATANYASMDAYAELNVFFELRRRLMDIETYRDGITLWDLFASEEVPFTHALYSCERNGVLLDIPLLEEKAEVAEKTIEKLAGEFNARARMPININSTPQLAHFFYDIQGRPIKKRTAGGKTGVRKPSVDAQVVDEWAKEGDVFSEILLEYRKHKKILSTYLKGWVKLADNSGRIHTTLNQGGTDTGRLSSRDPNLQNVPRPGDVEKDIYRLREAFIAPEGYVLIGADYDQLEMRIMAELADESSMIEMINRGWDIHSANASLMYDVEYDDIISAKKEKSALEGVGKKIPASIITLLGYRQDAKTIGFGLNYGQGVKALAEKLGCTKQEAQLKIEKYFEPFPNVRDFIDRVHDSLHANGEVFTYSGRIRQLSGGLNQADFGKLARAERQSVNTIIQGTAADIVRLAMIYCHQDPRLRASGAQMLLQIHDELLFQCPLDTAEDAKGYVQENMELPYSEEFSVLITATPEIGRKWTDVH